MNLEARRRMLWIAFADQVRGGYVFSLSLLCKKPFSSLFPNTMPSSPSRAIMGGAGLFTRITHIGRPQTGPPRMRGRALSFADPFNALSFQPPFAITSEQAHA